MSKEKIGGGNGIVGGGGHGDLKHGLRGYGVFLFNVEVLDICNYKFSEILGREKKRQDK